MSLPQYNDGYNHFDAAVLEAGILDGRRESGLNICHEFCDRWAVDPQKVALYYERIGDGDGTLTFAELKATSARFANYLKSTGVTKGDRVAGLLPRGPAMITGNDPFLQMFTSGTVGKAKGVAVPAKALLAFYVMKYATHFNLNPFTPESTYEMIRKYRITNLAAAPTAYRLLKASPLFHFDGYTWGEKDPFVNGYNLTGDMVICHGDGSFSFSGRDDDIITTAGPADVESTLLEHAAVAESGVVAKPDEKRGSIIKACVVIKSGQEPADDAVLKEELQELVRHRLSTHAYPREIEFVDELPKTPSGKIQRFVLRNRAKEEIAV